MWPYIYCLFKWFQSHRQILWSRNWIIIVLMEQFHPPVIWAVMCMTVINLLSRLFKGGHFLVLALESNHTCPQRKSLVLSCALCAVQCCKHQARSCKLIKTNLMCLQKKTCGSPGTLATGVFAIIPQVNITVEGSGFHNSYLCSHSPPCEFFFLSYIML